MTVSIRSYLTAGVAALGASAIALTPVQPLNHSLAMAPHKAISELAVNLAAAVTPVDPIQNIIDIITASSSNLETLVNNWAGGLYVNGTFPFPPNTALNGNLGWRTGGYATEAALPILSQVITNLETYIGELPDIGGIFGQIFDNLGNSLRAPFTAGVNQSGRVFNLLPSDYFNQNVNGTPYFNLDIGLGPLPTSQRDVGAVLPTLAGDAYATLEPIINLLTTPISGVLVGAIGPIVAPVLAVVNSISNTLALLQESNIAGAVTELINIPANVIGAVLNGGQTLDLTPLISLLGVTLPDSITSIGLKMGGLLSPGGVGLDALAAVASLDPQADPIVVPGLTVGPIGALAGLNSYVAKSIVLPAPVEAPVQTAAAVEAPAPAVEAVEAAAPASVPEVVAVEVSAPDEVSAPVSEPAADVADAADTTPAAPRAVNRGGRGGQTASAAGTDTSTPKRAARGAASRR